MLRKLILLVCLRITKERLFLRDLCSKKHGVDFVIMKQLKKPLFTQLAKGSPTHRSVC